MPSFVYQARDASGARVSGAREAASQQDARDFLRASGLFVTKLLPADSKEARALFPNGAPPAPSTPPADETVETTANLPARKWELKPESQAPPKTKPANAAAPRASTPASKSKLNGFDPLRTPPLPRKDLNAEARTEAAKPIAGTPVAAPIAVLPAPILAPVPPRYFLSSNSKALALFWSQMHSMLNAGVALSHATSTMAENAPSSGLRKACAEMSPRIAAGIPFSELMNSYPGIFSPLMIGMIRAGEAGGFLDRMCQRLGEYSERDYHIQQTIKRETWYPKMVLLSSIIIPSMPPLAIAFFTGKGVMAAAIACGLSMIGPLAFLAIVWVLWKFSNIMLPITARTNALRLVIDRAKLLTPIAGKTARALATAKFCRSLGALQAAGTGVQNMIHLAANACGNAVIAQSARSIIPHLEQGQSMTDALAATRQFPGIAIQMLRTGEATGNFEEQLDKVADFLEQDAETTIKQSVVVLGILALVFIGIRVCMQLVQFYTGYFNNIFDTVDQLQK